MDPDTATKALGVILALADKSLEFLSLSVFTGLSMTAELSEWIVDEAKKDPEEVSKTPDLLDVIGAL
ncbi:hypothetical protein EYF80_032246 [Liparis tanakae]|uniref:Uncharacterized protein n=1 Tax=Liparis tanakae TaxID=230148 RepID=A0A4Z2GXY4_9TELE|nr:hypothetical protein EYF80_032246 [Liparis tanakae]